MTALAPNDRFISLSPAAATTVLAYDFELMLDSGLTVQRIRAGVTSTLTLGVDYSFPDGIGNAAGGTLTLAAGSLDGDVYQLIGAQPEQRLSDFIGSQRFDVAKINADLDALTIVTQEHRRDIGRAVKAAYGTAGADLPPAEADKLIGWDGAGEKLENKTPAAIGLVVVSDDATLDGNSHEDVPTQHAVKGYVDGIFSAFWRPIVGLLTFAETWIALKLNGSLSTRALLKAVIPQAGMSILLTEAGRVGNFVWTLGDFSTHVAADPLEGYFIEVNTVAANVGAFVRDEDTSTLFARRFSTVGDGVADDTPAIQAAVNLGKFLGSGAVVVSKGDYKTTMAITSLANDLRIIGHGTATRIKPATAGQDCFVFGDGVNLIQHCGASNISIVPTAQIEAAMRAKYFFWFECNHVKVSGSHNVGFEIEKGPGGSYLAYLRDCFTNVSTNYGAAVGRLGTGSLLGVYLYNTHLNAAGQAGLRVESVSGLVWEGGESLQAERAIVLSPAAGQQVRACLFSSLFLDTPHSEVVRLELLSAGRRISTISFDNLSMNSSVTSSGLVIAGLAADPTLVDQIRVNNCEVTLNCMHGIYATYCTDVDIVCTQLTSNGQPGAGSGVYLDTGVSNVRLDGGSSGGGSGFTSSQLYGVVNAAGNTGVSVRGMNLAGNVTGPISDAGTGTIIKGCTGYINEAKGLVSGTTDASGDLVVTHGMSVTPTVILACRQGAATTGEVQPHTISATTFKIRFWTSTGAADASVARSAMWSAFGPGALT